jgi:Fic family protein
MNYVLYTVKTAYKEFEERVGQLRSPKGAKTELIRAAIDSFSREFTLSDIERTCPGVSRDMIRRVLRELQSRKEVECLGRGPGALWKKRGNTPKRG